MREKKHWLFEVEIFNNNKMDFLSFNDKTFVIDENTSKIVNTLKNNNFNFEKSLNYLNSNYYNNLSRIELDAYLNNLFESTLKKPKSNKLNKILILGNPSKFNWYNPLTKLFSFNNSLNYLIIGVIFLINILALNYIQNADATIMNISMLTNNIFYFVGLIALLFWHELGHIVAAKKHKLKIKEIGIGISFIFPVLYVDLNNIWILPKEKRTLINLGGIYFQLLFSLILIMLFEIFSFKVFVDLFSLNFSIILINMIPIFKFDGYWLLSDATGILNLSNKSNKSIKSFSTFNFKDLKKEKPLVLIYSMCRLLFYSYLFYLLIKMTKYLYFNLSIELIKNILTSRYFIIIISLLTLKFLLNYGKRIFKKEDGVI
jgi:putative peptide zinc metalloprotease protein